MLHRNECGKSATDEAITREPPPKTNHIEINYKMKEQHK